MQLFEEKYHPVTMLANRAVLIFNDNDALQEKFATRTKTTNIGQFLGHKG